MSGRVTPLFTKRTFTGTDLSAGQTVEQVVVKTLPAVNMKEGQLLVRVHSGTIGSNGSISVHAITTQPSSEEPSADFLGSTVATATVDSGDVGASAPVLVTGDLAANFGANLRIIVVATMSSGGGDTVEADLSADIVLKD